MCDVLILGARSWIGFRLTNAFRLIRPNWRVVGTSSSPVVTFPLGVDATPALVSAVTPDEFSELLGDMHPLIVINLLRGENENGMKVHLQVARLCATLGCRYVYASSALALDGYPLGKLLDENTRAFSITPYGQFKAACEAVLVDGFPSGNWQILRFSSIQGWSPWKPSRNEVFLRKLVAGESVTVDLGVRQNRLQDTVFASAVVDIVTHTNCRGVFHFGTEDASDEFDFLQAVARIFGQNESLVRSGIRRNVNLAVSCVRLHEETSNLWRRTEAQTLAGLRSDLGLMACLIPK